MRLPKLAALELLRFGRGKLPRVALVAIMVLPLLYGALYLWSFWDPYGRLDRIPVALVNADKGATADGKKIHAGDDITKKLLDSETFEWHQVSAADARKGVEKGTYYLSLSMPADFSKRIASNSGDSPETSALQVRTNDANNYIIGSISRSVFSEVRTAASTKTSRGFLGRIFISFSSIHDQTVKAANGADKLEGGIGKAEQGSKDLAAGLTTAKSGSSKLAGGLKKLTSGAGDLEDGSQQVADGTQTLADKVNGVASKVGPFLKDNEKTIGDTAQLVADSAKIIRKNLDTLVETAPIAAKGAHAAVDGLDKIYQARCVTATLPDDACADLKKAEQAATDVATIADDLNTLIADQRGDMKKLDTDLATLQKQAQALADRAPYLSSDLDDAVKKINKLNDGAAKVAAGAKTLHSGLGTAHTGASTLDKGVGKLEAGADTLSGGMYKLVDGSSTLAGGLHDGASQIPDYDKSDRDLRSTVMSDPVQLASKDIHAASNYGTGFAPFFIPLSLWVGAMVSYMLIPPMNRRALAAGASARRIALAGWLPVAVVGVIQMLALMTVLHFAIGLQMARTAGTVAFLALTAISFAALVQWLNALFGVAGRVFVLALLMLQLTAAGGTYPIETSPGFFTAIHPFLPMTYVIEALRRLISGGGLQPVWHACAVLTAFMVCSLALTAFSARRQQVWTVRRLHPELTL
ncbi:YhgE/Pip family protein [Streptomyces sp. YIM S03343]